MSATPPAAGGGAPFLTAELAQRLDLAEHLLEFGPRAVLIVGPAGSGRSTFLQALLARAPGHWRVATIEAGSLAGGDDLAARIASAWELEPEDPPWPEAASTLHRRGSLPVLAVDDLDALPAAALETLASILTGGTEDAPVRLLATADSAALGRLRRLLGEYLHVIELPPLTAAQAEEFVHRLLARGGVPESPGDDRRWIAELYRRSRGRPGPLIDGLVEELARRGRAAGSAGGVLQRAPTALLALTAGALVLSGGLLLWLWPEPEEAPTTLALTTPAAQPPAAKPPAAKPPAAKPPAAKPPAAQPPAAQPPAAQPPAAQPPAAQPPAAQPPAAQPPAAKPPAVAPPAPVRPAAERPAAPPRPALPPRPAPPAGLEGVAGPAWIAAQPPTHLTWQLLVSGDAAALARFVRAHGGLREALAWYPLERDGRRLLALVWGSFPDRERALAARRRLPPDVVRLRPWLRPFAAIQQRLPAGGAPPRG